MIQASSGFGITRRAFGLSVVAGLGVAAAPLIAGKAAAAAAHIIYAAPDGSRQAVGSDAEPTDLLGAQQKVRDLLPFATGPIEVRLSGGRYSLSATLSFGPADSGSPTVPVRWLAKAGQRPVFAGGRSIIAQWTPYRNGIYVADLPANLDFDQLFVAGSRKILARYPNFDPKPGAILGGYAKDAIAPERIKTWSNPKTGLVRALHNYEWGGNSFKIKGVLANGNADLEWVGDNNRGSGINTVERMVENIFEELNAPGEWFYDLPTGKLYFYPEDGKNPGAASIGLGELNELIRVEGASTANPVRDLSFTGIAYTQTHRTLFNSSYEKMLLGDWAIVRSAAVVLKNTERVDVRDSSFVQIGGNAVFIDGYNKGNVLDNNVFDQVGASAVVTAGAKSAVRSPSSFEQFQKTWPDLTPGPLTEDYPRDITVSNSLMTNLGIYELQTAGVQISVAQRISVLNNTIHDVPRAGINVNDGTWGGHRIARNAIWNTVQQTGDHGPINAWGRDRWWPFSAPTGVSYSKNQSKDADTLRKAMKADAVETTVIEQNRIWHSSDWAIDLDDGSSNYLVQNNLLLNSGIKIRDGFERIARNNMIVNGSIFEQVAFPGNGDEVSKNVILRAMPYNNYGDEASDPRITKMVYAGNTFWNDGGAIAIGRQDNGTTQTLQQWQAKGADQDSIVADPRIAAGSPWLDPNLLDYTLSADSPALTLGYQNIPMDNFGRPGNTERPPATVMTAVVVVPTRESVIEPWLGSSLVGITTTGMASVVGRPIGQGQVVGEVPAGSAAAAAGLLQNDVVIGVNGARVTDKNSFWTVWNTIPAGSQVSFELSRKQNPATATLTRPGGAEKINNTSGVMYTGTGWDWKAKNRGGANSFLDDLDASTVQGDSAELAFYGTSVKFITQTNLDEAVVTVSLDGGPGVPVSLKTTTRKYQSTVFTSPSLAAGRHTIKITSTTAGYFLVDAFEITR